MTKAFVSGALRSLRAVTTGRDLVKGQRLVPTASPYRTSYQLLTVTWSIFSTTIKTSLNLITDTTTFLILHAFVTHLGGIST